ncbi:MAG: ParB N-terminal domain-containing protein [Tannerella sp.]|jgi:ParB-like chromosome segregation protein Spo0J|nr:ParB N-terminal domain-containing protein [Tannerella sp.]
MKYVNIDILKPNKLNPRKISIKQVEKLSVSLKENPEYFEARPIICDSQYTVWAGHSRLKAAKYLGLKEAPVHIIDLPEEKMKEIMIRDNVNNGEWDTNILSDLWDEELDLLADFGLEFKSSGWGDDEADEAGEAQDAVNGKSKKSKKTKEKKIIECPHCKNEIEI